MDLQKLLCLDLIFKKTELLNKFLKYFTYFLSKIL